MKTVKASETRFPTLTRAVLRHIDRERLIDVCNYGASGGYSGFTYYKDTLVFFNRHKADILEMAKQIADDIGNDGLISFVAGFNCLKGYSQEEIADGIYNGKGENATQVRNALAWFALEEVARELNPDL